MTEQTKMTAGEMLKVTACFLAATLLLSFTMEVFDKWRKNDLTLREWVRRDGVALEDYEFNPLEPGGFMVGFEASCTEYWISEGTFMPENSDCPECIRVFERFSDIADSEGIAAAERSLRSAFAENRGLLMKSLWSLRKTITEKVRLRDGGIVTPENEEESLRDWVRSKKTKQLFEEIFYSMK